MSSKLIALSFDDGPSISTTGEVLDVLQKHDITASFFVLGQNIIESTKALVKRAFDMGCDIQNHSYTHSAMADMDNLSIAKEIGDTSEKIVNIIGAAPRFFRPPYIALSDSLYDQVDLTFICGKGVDDWDDSVSVAQRVNGIINQAEDGTIVLLHDMQGNSATVKAIDIVIPKLKELGYEFVTVSELFERKGVAPKPNDKIIYSVVK
ncbi:MAG: polysaccharide deacetylase family protein [Ruminococcus sp.]|nr:polysaccharide deacetylase family protein [Ruminococcus sp.]